MSKLNLYPVAETYELVQSEASPRFSLDSPAKQFLTDFYKVQPVVIQSSTSAKDTLDTMIKTHVRMMLVVDEHKQFLGVITAADVDNQNILAKATQHHEKPDEVKVTDLMKRKKDLLAFNADELVEASIRDVISVLQDNHQQHCLVIEPAIGQVRGLFSASDISRKLHLPINIQEQSSFSKVFASVQ